MGTLRRRFGAVGAAVALSLVAVAGTAAADSSNPTFVSGPFEPVIQATSFAVGSLGLTPLTLYPNTHCVRGQAQSKSLASIIVPGVLTASALQATCAVSADGTEAAAGVTIGKLSLLGGKVQVTALDARCTRAADGTATFGSTWGSLVTAGNYARNGQGAIVIPGVADIVINERYAGGTFGDAEFLVINIYLQQVGGVTIVPAQSLVISGCFLDSYT